MTIELNQEEIRSRDEATADGYRLLSADTAQFADAAGPVATETWPEWESEGEQVDAALSFELDV